MISKSDVTTAANAVRDEMRTLRVQWFVEDAAVPEDESHDLTPYVCLAVAALRAAGIDLPDWYPRR